MALPFTHRAHRARRRRLTGPVLLIVIGALVTLVAGTLAWRQTRPVAEFGSDAGAVAHGPAEAAGPPAGRIPVVDGRPPKVDLSSPVRIEVPAIDLTATVVAVGVDSESGEIELPPRVDTVGWYRYGPDLRATAGSIVIAGHVDNETVLGAFSGLKDVPPGGKVTITDEDGDARSFVVVSREVFAKPDLPVDRLFAPTGPLRLTLITCGGAFDAESRSYQDNVVVTAVPA